MNWNRFLFVALPAVMAGLGLTAEGLAYLVRDVAPRRHDLDIQVAALDHPQPAAAIVLAGDSVTQDVVKTFAVAAPGQLANLTTNQASGAIGTALLLDRYLAASPTPPRVVAIAATPEFLSHQPEGPAARQYLTSVFRRDGEKEALHQAGVAEPAGAVLPAAFSLELKLGYPLTGLVAARVDTLPAGTADPDAVPMPGPSEPIDGVPAQITRRASETLDLSPSAASALRHICTRARELGFALHLARAPMPATVDQRQSARETALWDAVAEATAGCPSVTRADFNRATPYPDVAFRDSDHLRRPEWTAVYARQLKEWLGRMPVDADEMATKKGIR